MTSCWGAVGTAGITHTCGHLSGVSSEHVNSPCPFPRLGWWDRSAPVTCDPESCHGLPPYEQRPTACLWVSSSPALVFPDPVVKVIFLITLTSDHRSLLLQHLGWDGVDWCLYLPRPVLNPREAPNPPCSVTPPALTFTVPFGLGSPPLVLNSSSFFRASNSLLVPPKLD